MADQFIRVPVDGPGKRVDTEEITVNLLLVHRERNQIAGVGATEIARVLDTDPAGADFALVVRQAPPVNPKADYVTSAALPISTSVDLDASTISAATTGKLMRVIVSSSVPCFWEVKTRDGGVEVIKAGFMTSGVNGDPTYTFEPFSKDEITLAGAGVDENFRVTATNLGTQAFDAADVMTTIEWDEV